ncbi:g5734 [Coccomyxa viridis]|uniref:G5734 protein n=1 Tax=Coccomyxa viridis TaxID=1274662 RepID=A0ABP1FYP6_9CHLO
MGKTGKIGYKIKPEIDNTQVLNTKQGKPTKYKTIEPTLITDLELHQPERYKGPSDKELDHLDEGDFIMIAYINKEEVWLVVERVDEDEKSLINAKVAQRIRMVGELQQNQRVAVRREHVVAIRFHDEEVY